MHIVIATDSNPHYLKQCFIMLYSLLKYNQDSEITLHIFHTAETKEIFERKWEYLSHFVWVTHVIVSYYEVSRKTIEEKWLQIYNKLPLTTYFRLLIPNLLDASISKCLYLDTDLIIRWSLQELFQRELSESDWVVWVKTNILTEYMKNIDVNDYINAWVLLINLIERRRRKLSDQIIQFINTYPNGLHNIQAIMGDQCGINAVCSWHIHYIDPIRNCTPFRFNTPWLSEFQWSLWYDATVIEKTNNNPIILHFAGKHKPCDWISFNPRKLSYYRYCLESWLFTVTDLCKLLRHTISYPLCSNQPIYSLIRQLNTSKK